MTEPIEMLFWMSTCVACIIDAWEPVGRRPLTPALCLWQTIISCLGLKIEVSVSGSDLSVVQFRDVSRHFQAKRAILVRRSTL